MKRSFVAVLLVMVASRPASAVSNVCFDSGGCDINHPTYVNVFWETSRAKWDAELSSNGNATTERIDALTAALIHSDYFAALAQYHVTTAKFRAGVVATDCGPPPATIEDAYAHMTELAICVRKMHPELTHLSTILNVYLPPQTRPSTSDWCAGSGSASGKHDQFFTAASPFDPTPDAVVAIIPTNTKCNSGLSGIFAVATHEMVEAATDPNYRSPSGWKTCCNPVEEVADQCEHSTATRSAPFMFARVSQYFSDSANACSAGFSLTPPKVTSKAVCGSGSAMRISLTGKFGDTPWDLTTTPAEGAAPASSKTLYLQAAISGKHTWSAGSLEATATPDLVHLGKIKWEGNGAKPDTIVIDGFDEHYGVAAPGGGASVVSPGDKVTLTILAPASGQSTTAVITAPAPSKVTGFKAVPSYFWISPSWISYGDPITVVGKLEDGGCGNQGVEVKLTSTDASPDTQQTTSDREGDFEVAYHLHGAAGKHTIEMTSPLSASTTVAIHPRADSLSAVIGSTTGNQAVTLLGLGYAAGAKVVFRSGSNHANATSVVVGPSPSSSYDGQPVTFRTPPSPLPGGGPGVVEVVAIMDGVESAPLSYTYVVPQQPVLSVEAPACPWDASTLEADAYQADGTPAAESIDLTADYAAFLGSSGSPTAAVTVAAGSSVKLKGPGPVTITATPTGNPALEVKHKFKLPGPTSNCKPPQYDAYQVQVVNGGGPVETAVLRPQVGVQVYWATRDGVANGTFVMAPRTATADVAAELDVRDVGSRALGATLRTQSKVHAEAAGKVGKIAFLGPAFSIGSRTPESVSSILTAPATVSFAVPKPDDAGRLRIVRLARGATAWEEVKSAVDGVRGSSAIRASVTAGGTYALVRLE